MATLRTTTITATTGTAIRPATTHRSAGTQAVRHAVRAATATAAPLPTRTSASERCSRLARGCDSGASAQRRRCARGLLGVDGDALTGGANVVPQSRPGGSGSLAPGGAEIELSLSEPTCFLPAQPSAAT